MTMWILLNNKPLDLSTIKAISEVKPLTLLDLYKAYGEDNNEFANELNKLFPKEVSIWDNMELYHEYHKFLEGTIPEVGKIYGYYFHITHTKTYQTMMNGTHNGLVWLNGYHISKLHSTKEDAQVSLDNLLTEINMQLSILTKVEI